jgi:hypothetical protein
VHNLPAGTEAVSPLRTRTPMPGLSAA